MITHNKEGIIYALYRDYTKVSNPVCVSRYIEKSTDSADIILKDDDDFIDMAEYLFRKYDMGIKETKDD